MTNRNQLGRAQYIFEGASRAIGYTVIGRASRLDVVSPPRYRTRRGGLAGQNIYKLHAIGGSFARKRLGSFSRNRGIREGLDKTQHVLGGDTILLRGQNARALGLGHFPLFPNTRNADNWRMPRDLELPPPPRQTPISMKQGTGQRGKY